MKNGILAAVSATFAGASWKLQDVAHVASIAAACVAIIAALPVVYDRWSPVVRRFFARRENRD